MGEKMVHEKEFLLYKKDILLMNLLKHISELW